MNEKMSISQEESSRIPFSNAAKCSNRVAITNIVLYSLILGTCIISLIYMGIAWEPFTNHGRCDLCGLSDAVFILGLAMTIAAGISLTTGILLFFGVKQRSRPKCIAFACLQILILMGLLALFAYIVISSVVLWLHWGFTLLNVVLIIIQILQITLVIRFIREISNDEFSSTIV